MFNKIIDKKSIRFSRLISIMLIICQSMIVCPANIYANPLNDAALEDVEQVDDLNYDTEIIEKIDEDDGEIIEEIPDEIIQSEEILEEDSNIIYEDEGISIEEVDETDECLYGCADESEELAGIVEDPIELAGGDGSTTVSMNEVCDVLENTGKDFRADAAPIGKANLSLVKSGLVAGDNTYSEAVAKEEVRVPRYVIIHSEVTLLSENMAKTNVMKYATEQFIQGKEILPGNFRDGSGNSVTGAYEEFMENLRIYDYTEGFPISDEGYLMDDKGNVVLNGVSDNKYPTYLGYVFEINKIDENTFKQDGAENIKKIKLPMTITTDIDYTFFEKCTSNQRVEVYFQNTDEVNTNISPKYLSAATTDQKNTAAAYGADDTGVLLKKLSWSQKADGSPSDCREYEVVYCPPKYNKSFYCFPFNDSYYGTTYKIGEHAFENCKGLQKIAWRDAVGKSSVISIGDYAFYNCEGLVNADIFDKQLKYIGNYAFSGCKKLGSESNPRNALYDHTINLGVGDYGNNTVIGKRAFYDTVIETLRIPSGYRTISGESLYGMNSLREITMDRFGAENPAFDTDEGILYRKLGADKKERELVCFPALKEIDNSDEVVEKIKGLPYADDYKGDEKEYTFMVPYYVTDLDDYAFSNCANLENLILLSTLYSMKPHSVYGCKGLVNIYSHSGLPDMDYSLANNYLEDCSSSKINLHIHAPKYFNSGIKRGLYNFAVDNGYTTTMLFDINAYTIADGALKKYNATSSDSNFVSDVFIPDFIIKDDGAGEYKEYTTDVEDGAFIDCEDITSVTILNHLQYLPSSAFINFDENSIDADKYPKELVNIFVEDGNNCFMTQGGALYKLNPENGDIEELIFYPPSNESRVFIAAKTLKRLPRYAFRGAKNLEVIKIYSSIEQIGYYKLSGNELCDEPSTFEGCSSLYEIDILDDPDALVVRYTSSDGVLYRWSSSEHTLVYFPKGERRWQLNGHNGGVYRVLDGCEDIRDVKDVKGLTAIYIPKSVEIIEEKAFSGSNTLKDVYFSMTGDGKGLKTIGDKAFSGCALRSLTLPYTLATIGEEAFTNNSLRSLVIYTDNLKTIGKKAFNGQVALETVQMLPYDKNSKGKVLTIEDEAFGNDVSVRKYDISGVDRLTIGDGVFRNNTSMTSFNTGSFPIVSIGQRAFLNCNKLGSIDLSYYKGAYSIQKIPSDAFNGCSMLTEVTLPKSVTDIESRAFYDCKSLELLNFYNLPALQRIGKQAFENCNFKQVNFTKNSSLNYLGSHFIKGNKNLTTIYIPATINNFEADNTFDYLGRSTIVYTTKGAPVAKKVINELNSQYDLKPAEEYDDPLHEIEYDIYEDWRGPKISYGDILSYKVIVTTDDPTPFFKQSIGATRQFSASVVNLSGTEQAVQDVKWRSLNEDIITVDDNGLVTLVSSEYVGTVYVEAISTFTGDFGKCGIEIKDATIYINGVDGENAYVVVNSSGKNRTTNINATVNPTRNLYYQIIAGKDRIKISKTGVITGLKRGTARVKVYAKEGDGSEYSTYMETFVNVLVVTPSIKVNQKMVKVYGAYSKPEPVDYTKENYLSGATSNSNQALTPEEIAAANYTHKTVYVTCVSTGPAKEDKNNFVDNHVTWSLPNTNVAYMLDKNGKEVSELTTVVGGDGNRSDVASVEVYSSSNVNKNVKLKATYNGITRTITVKVVKIATSIRPVALDIYDAGKNPRLKIKITGPDKKNLKWSFYNEDATVCEYITGVDKKGNILLGPNIFTKNSKEKTVYAYLTANGVTSDPCEIHICKATTTIEPEDADTITINDTKYIFLNSQGNNSIKVRCSVEGPDIKNIKWNSLDKTIAKTTGKNGQITLTGVDCGKTSITATANAVTAEYPVLVVNTYTEFTSGDGIELELDREYKSKDKANKLSVRVNGTDPEANITWKSSDPEVCRIIATDTGIDGEKLSTYKISRGGDYGYGRMGKAELKPVKKGSCYITAEANGVVAKYKIKVE